MSIELKGGTVTIKGIDEADNVLVVARTEDAVRDALSR